jgi:hypothetical protein
VTATSPSSQTQLHKALPAILRGRTTISYSLPISLSSLPFTFCNPPRSASLIDRWSRAKQIGYAARLRYVNWLPRRMHDAPFAGDADVECGSSLNTFFAKPCAILWFIISLGGLFRRNSGTGTACGSGSGA